MIPPLKLPSVAVSADVANKQKSGASGKIGIMVSLKIGNSRPKEKPRLHVVPPSGYYKSNRQFCLTNLLFPLPRFGAPRGPFSTCMPPLLQQNCCAARAAAWADVTMPKMQRAHCSSENTSSQKRARSKSKIKHGQAQHGAPILVRPKDRCEHHRFDGHDQGRRC